MSPENGKVVWLGARRSRSVEAPSVADSFVVFLLFIGATCLAAEFLARALVVWMEFERNVALTFIATSAFL
jgi:hypothetical protein